MPSRDFALVGTAERLAAVRQWYAASRDPDPARRPPPQPVRPASTVMLLRDGSDGGVEVVVLKRAATMAFAASFHAFPGGAVEPEDGVGATGHLAAAVREVEEECGLRLDPATVRPRAHWVGPPFEPRRFDTWIYAAPVPPGSAIESTTTEAESMTWVRPGAVLAGHARGDVYLLPPTLVSLEGLAAYDTVTAYLDSTPDLSTVEPVLVAVGDELVMRIGGDAS